MIESICKKDLKHFFYEESGNFLISGKKKDNEVCIDFFLKALSEKNPDENQLVMIDTQDKFKKYENDPHLSMPVVTNIEEGVRTLDFLVSKMDRRYQTLSEHHARDIAEYNRDPGTSCKMPFVTVIVNDFEDLAKSHKIKVEYSILKLVQKGIGTGFNLILSTLILRRENEIEACVFPFLYEFENRVLDFYPVGLREVFKVIRDDSDERHFAGGTGITIVFCDISGVMFRQRLVAPVHFGN